MKNLAPKKIFIKIGKILLKGIPRFVKRSTTKYFYVTNQL